MIRIPALITLALVLGACANTNCREMREKSGVVAAPAIKKELDPMAKTASADRVKVSKPDGSLQCQQGKPIPPAEMQKELAGITVHASASMNDGLMRIQLCGTPTGTHNVYEIDRKDLEKALKLGFKEWTVD